MGHAPYHSATLMIPVGGPAAPPVTRGHRCADPRGVPGMRWARLQTNLNIAVRRGAWYRLPQLGPPPTVIVIPGPPVEGAAPFLLMPQAPPPAVAVVPPPPRPGAGPTARG